VWSVQGVDQRRALRSHSGVLIQLGLLAWLCSAWLSSPVRAAEPQAEATGTHGIVELETEEAAGGSVAIAEDLASIVDNSSVKRLLPVVGKSAQQSLFDLLHLPGIALAILPTDVLDVARRQDLYPDIEHEVSYVTVLYSQELHLLARPEIKSLADLTGRSVNVGVIGSGTALTASRLFGLLNITATLTYERERPALEKLRQGEISALALVAPRPAPLFLGIRPEERLHFIAVPLEPTVINAYVPTKLDPGDYPNLIRPGESVDTIAVATVLAAGKSEPDSTQYRDVAAFVDTFFSHVGVLLQPGHHPKWQEVNLAALFPGWNRFPAAQQWLDRNGAGAPTSTQPQTETTGARQPPARSATEAGSARPVGSNKATPEEIIPPSAEPKSEPTAEQNAPKTEAKAQEKAGESDLRIRFARFLEAHKGTLGANMTTAQKEELFEQFKRWRAAQGR
jgi:TRAP-type uncharacterized transport system substrate-binding protein